MVVLAAVPSASVAFVVARSATLGVTSGFAVAAGIVLEDLVFVVLALLGLSVMAEAMGSLFMLIKYLGGGYLIWLGYSLLSKSGLVKTKENKTSSNRSLVSSFIAGFVLTLGDIKVILFYASILPVFFDLSDIQTFDVIALIFITVFSVGGVKVIYVIFSSSIAAYTHKKNMEIVARKTMGGLMVGAGCYLIVKA